MGQVIAHIEGQINTVELVAFYELFSNEIIFEENFCCLIVDSRAIGFYHTQKSGKLLLFAKDKT